MSCPLADRQDIHVCSLTERLVRVFEVIDNHRIIAANNHACFIHNEDDLFPERKLRYEKRRCKSLGVGSSMLDAARYAHALSIFSRCALTYVVSSALLCSLLVLVFVSESLSDLVQSEKRVL